MSKLVLIRGLPGSGKSTEAKTLDGFKHFEADMFFIDENGEYKYDASKIKDAHNWCKLETYKAVKNKQDVVVSNTFTTNREIEPYFDIADMFGITPVIVECKGKWENVHNVPEDVIKRMTDRWEELK